MEYQWNLEVEFLMIKFSSQLPKNKIFSPKENSSMYNLINETNPDIILFYKKQDAMNQLENWPKLKNITVILILQN